MTRALVETLDLEMHFTVRKTTVRAVDGVSVTIHPKETVGLVGESGSGKSTLGKTILRLHQPTGGRVLFDGTDITSMSRGELRPLRRRMQIVFQDPYGALNPRMTVGQTVTEALSFFRVAERQQIQTRAEELFGLVGLSPQVMKKFPHELSGGQRQRVGIARALSVQPDFIVADEPVSALDVSVRAQILTLLDSIRSELGLTLLFVSHDLSVVEHFCDRVLVMYLGRIMESLPARDLDKNVRHPYSRALLDAAPRISTAARPPRVALEGDVPSPTDIPPGCPFSTRCPKVEPSCKIERPSLLPIADDHFVACPVVA